MKLFGRAALIILLELALLSSGCGCRVNQALISDQSNLQMPTTSAPVSPTTNAPVNIGRQVSPENKENDFNFILQYGVSARNQIDTFNGTYTKDLISAGTKTIKLELNDTELSKIQEQMKQINILDYPEQFEPEINIWVTPNHTYHLKINIDGTAREIHWEDYNCYDIPGFAKPVEPIEATQLRNVIKNIITIIEQKEEYKKLPPAVGGYD